MPSATRDYRLLDDNFDCQHNLSYCRTFSWGFSQLFVQFALQDFVALSKPQIVIDIPVGTGRFLEYLKAVDCQAIGFDYTQEMLDEARKVMDNERHQLQQGNASDTGFADGKFDCLISLRFFHLFAKNERAPFAREFRRITRPGGHAIISFTNGWYAGGIN